MNSNVEQHVNAAIQAGIDQIARQYKLVNAVSTTDLKTQVDDLNAKVYQLCGQIRVLSSKIITVEKENKNQNTRIQPSNHSTQKGNAEKKFTWTTDGPSL